MFSFLDLIDSKSYISEYLLSLTAPVDSLSISTRLSPRNFKRYFVRHREISVVTVAEEGSKKATCGRTWCQLHQPVPTSEDAIDGRGAL
jgi:hypothetical protein